MIEVRRLREGDDRSGFTSGNPDLDRFFRGYAGQNQFRHHIGVTYVAIEEGEILGFVTVTPSEIEIDALPEAKKNRMPGYPLPVLRLARLAVAASRSGAGVGRLLLRTVFGLASEMSGTLGCVGVVVDAKPEAVEYYRAFGFEEIEVLEGMLGERPLPITMFLPLQSIPVPVRVPA
jgi:predicted N-acetyltransferase YhbS